jgi:hypothetical protein
MALHFGQEESLPAELAKLRQVITFKLVMPFKFGVLLVAQATKSGFFSLNFGLKQVKLAV